MFGKRKDNARKKLEAGFALTIAFYYALGRLDEVSDNRYTNQDIAADFANFAQDLGFEISLNSGWNTYSELLRSLKRVNPLPKGHLSDEEWEDYSKFLGIDDGSDPRTN